MSLSSLINGLAGTRETIIIHIPHLYTEEKNDLLIYALFLSDGLEYNQIRNSKENLLYF